MKVKKYENLNTSDTNEEEIIIRNEEEITSMIEDIIGYEIELRDVPYSMQEHDTEVDPDSITSTAKAIVKALKEKGLI